jgi:membrane protease YdiL (CAAX protease family)
VDDTIDNLTPAASPIAAPAFSGARWNGWVLLVVGILCMLAFFAMQTIVFFIILIKAHPGAMAISPNDLNQNALIKLITAKNLWYMTVTSELVLATSTLLLARYWLGASAKTLGLGKWPATQWIVFGIAGGVLLFLASGIVEKAQSLILGPEPPQFQALLLAQHHGGFNFILDLMSVSIAAPFAEETFFRGLVFTGLAQRIPIVWAAVISATLFALAHFEKYSLLPIFVIGLGLAYVYYTTRSLWASMCAHATVNMISLVIAYLFPALVK